MKHFRGVALFSFLAAASLHGAQQDLPVIYEPNRGQADPGVDFVSRRAGQTLLVNGAGARLLLQGQDGALRLDLDRARPATPEPLDRAPGYSNYILGSDAAGWIHGVPHFERVRYSGVWDRVDVVYHSDHRSWEYDFLLHPGADASAVRLRIGGANGVSLDESGNLVLEFAGRRLVQKRPEAFQIDGGRRVAVEAEYSIGERTAGGVLVHFALGPYDASRDLVIDPVLTYGVLVGGDGEDAAWSIAVDSTGSAFIAGTTTSVSFRNSPQISQYRGLQDCFVTRLNPAGNAILFTAYVGGSDFDDCRSITLNALGQPIVGGYTYSSNFPTTSGVLQSTRQGDADGVLFKLSASGSALYSTYFGGNGFDVLPAVAADAVGNVWATGTTTSTNFPVTGNAIQPTKSGGFDAILIGLNPTGSLLVFGTYFGGPGDDQGLAIDVDNTGRRYIAGTTRSLTLPGLRPNSSQQVFGGTEDAFLARIDVSGTLFVTNAFTTYLGGSAGDGAFSVKIDVNEYVLVAGYTLSSNFPHTTAALQSGAGGGTSDGFVAAYTPGGARVFSSILGGSGYDVATSVLAGSDPGVVYVAGLTSLPTFLGPVGGFSANANAFAVGFRYQTLSPNPIQNGFFLRTLLAKTAGSTILAGAFPLVPVSIAKSSPPTGDEVYLAGAAAPDFEFPAARTLGSVGGLSDAFVVKLANTTLSLSIRFPDFPEGNVSVFPGGNVAVNLLASNTGANVSSNTVVTLAIPDGATVVRCTPAAGACSISGRTITVNVGSLAPGASVQTSVVFRAPLGGFNSGLAIASLTSDTNDPFSADNAGAPAFLQKQGTIPFVLDQESLEFPLTPVNSTSSPLAFRVTLANGADPEIKPVVPPETPAVFTLTFPEPNGTLQGAVRFRPTLPTEYNGFVDVKHPGTGYARTVKLKGSGASVLEITAPPSLADGTAGVPYGPVQFTAAGGTGSYTWSATGVPANMTFNAAGQLAGTPAANGTFNLSITVNSGGVQANRPYMLIVNPNTNVGLNINSFTATPNSISSGGSSTLAWNVSGATSVTISGLGTVVVAGSRSVTPTATTVYTLTATNGSQSRMQTVTVTVVSPNAPVINPGGVVTVAAGVQQLTPLGLVSIYGRNFTSGQPRDWNGVVSFTLAGVSVSIDGRPALPLYVSSEFMNVQVPDTPTRGMVNVTVTNASGTSAPVQVQMVGLAPEFKGWSATAVESTRGGPRPPAAPNCASVSCPVGPVGVAGLADATPARPGETISLWALGFGPSNPAIASGTIGGSPSRLVNTVEVRINGAPVTLPFGAFLQGVGLYQMDIIVPQLPDGEYDLEATVGGVRTLKTMKLAIRQ